ncbi:hypothetical protein BRC81_03065 [Halobacteriales archaeon QS_1_68_20]|nr:MAG: hypothetical protein BRC81_03065 [Halobacteriales archaeon QS_1_68_20]
MTDAATEKRVLDRLEWLFTQHVGPDDAITVDTIAAAMPDVDGDGHATKPATREAIKTLIEEREVPVVSGPDGYYRATSEAQVEDYYERVRSRAQATLDRGRIVKEAWDAAGPPGGEDEDVDDDLGLTPEERRRVKEDPVLTMADVREYGGGEA